MDINFLPNHIRAALYKLNLNNIYEIRLRNNYPIKVNILGKNCNLKSDDNKEIICDQQDISTIIQVLTEKSIYAFNEQIKQGYLAYKNGVRIGIAGEYVVENEKVITIKNISSLNIRLPHNIFGCSDYIYEKVFSNDIKNTLIVSSPFMGKTTILKDLIRRFNVDGNNNILVLDERGEFCDCSGENVDIISFLHKKQAFINGLKTMSPNIVFMDELSSYKDWDCACFASNNGVVIVASTHANCIEDLLNKPYFRTKIFYKYVFLDNNDKKGVVKHVYNGDFNEL